MCHPLIIIWKHTGLLQILYPKPLKSYDKKKSIFANTGFPFPNAKNKGKSYRKEKAGRERGWAVQASCSALLKKKKSLKPNIQTHILSSTLQLHPCLFHCIIKRWGLKLSYGSQSHALLPLVIMGKKQLEEANLEAEKYPQGRECQEFTG